MLRKIWEIYFIKEVFKTFSLIACSFFALYVLIDYASHSSHHYHHSTMNWNELAKHYLGEFVLRADVLLPFALLVAVIRTLFRLNTNNELLALMAAGIPIKILLRPFVLAGLLLTGLIYLNTEYLYPVVMQHTRHLYDAKSVLKNKKNKKLFVQHVVLQDHTTLLFQEYDLGEKKFLDAYWIRSFDEVWRFQLLYPYFSSPKGVGVDLLLRNKEGVMTKSGSFEEREFPEMRFNRTTLLETLTPPEGLSLSLLWKKLPQDTTTLNEKQSELTAAFFHKLAVPWLCLLAVIGPAPFCIRYSRIQSSFFVYALGIFGMVACYLILDAAKVLGGRQVLSSHLAIAIPFGFMLCGSLFNFFRIK